MTVNLNGIGNKASGLSEMLETISIHKEWLARSAKRRPGTHSLGKAFQTVSVKVDTA